MDIGFGVYLLERDDASAAPKLGSIIGVPIIDPSGKYVGICPLGTGKAGLGLTVAILRAIAAYGSSGPNKNGLK